MCKLGTVVTTTAFKSAVVTKNTITNQLLIYEDVVLRRLV